MKRTNTCGELTLKDVDKKVVLQGWVKKIRKFGALTFVDLRDRYGYTQLIISEKHKKFLENLKPEYPEYVIEVTGIVQARKTPNLNIATGEIEVEVKDLVLINKAELLPFQIDDETEALWDTRLKYRYLDLRRPSVQQNLIVRSQVNHLIRNFFVANNFIEVETPIFGKSTPEGARDFLVPSRLNKNKFYALPQSPQLYKQLLMVSGFDRYFQIVKCFRDEDLRIDRELEFTQLDMEMSFATAADVMEIMETLMKTILREIANDDIMEPIERITYQEAIEKYGSDKPDLRFDLPIRTLTDIFKHSKNKLLHKLVTQKQVIRGIAINELLTKTQISQLDEQARQFNISGITFAKVEFFDGYQKWTGPLASTLSEAEQKALINEFKIEQNSTIILNGEEYDKISQVFGAIRNTLGKMFSLYELQYKLLWVVDFPLFEYSEEEKRYVAAHHPFTMPAEKSLKDFDTNKKEALSNAYDLVLNGFEIGGGSQRITNPELQQRMFQAVGLTEKQIQRDFAWFVNAYNYGAPYHAGMALGLDRILMLLTNAESIREVIAFPKNLSGVDPLSGAPGDVEQRQLDDLAIEMVIEKK